VIWRRLEQVPADDPLPWSYGVARRCLANHRRGSQRRERLVHRIARTPDRAERDPSEIVAEHDATLADAIERLSTSEAEIVRLWAWEQLEPREIAAALDMTANAVSVALSRAKRKLAAEIDRQDRPPSGQEPGVGPNRSTTKRSRR
jgi:RNA polymerase sigma-70 factor (ECF subfamily)